MMVRTGPSEPARPGVYAGPRYQPIEDYGLIGDLHTVALVGLNGSIDWLCLPAFDSPSVFGALLDADKGGSFRISPTDPAARYKQFYWPETNVLVTRFFSTHGVAELTDFMPVGGISGAKSRHQVIRRLTVVRGTMNFRLECAPSFDYARAQHDTELRPDGAVFSGPDLRLGLATSLPLTELTEAVPGGSGVFAEFELKECVEETIVLQQMPRDDGSCGVSLNTEDSQDLFEKTVEYWRKWIK